VLDALARYPLRLLAHGWVLVQRALGRGPGTRPGVHAVALTPGGRIVLVRLRYATGWRLPGGGRGTREDPLAAVLRELTEEIGLLAHGAVEPLQPGELYLVRDVVYRPRWTMEVEAVMEAGLDALPGDLAEPARLALVEARLRLSGFLPDSGR